MQYHKYSLTELEDMIPWEREIYVEMLMQHIKEENEKIREKQRKGQKYELFKKHAYNRLEWFQTWL